jgi:peptidoglycan hydrolase-like protein with peptidoglycan-binding domain
MEFSAYLFDALAYEQATQTIDSGTAQHDELPNSAGIFADRLVVSGLMPALVLACAIAAPLTTPKVLAADRPFCNPVYLCNTSYIIEIQTLLTKQGLAPGGIDGVYGPVTAAAIAQFQERHGGLAIDGLPGTQTLAALRGLNTELGFEGEPRRGTVPPKDQTRPTISGQKPNTTANADPKIAPSTNQKTNKKLDPTQTNLAREEISALQLLLKMRGFYDRNVDGVQGSAMTMALIKAQRAYGLPENGLSDPILIASLRAGTRISLPNYQPLVNPASQEEVINLQKQLKQRGFYDGNTHGKLDAQTRAAIMDAQAAYGLVVDGDFSPSFLSFLSSQSYEPRS